MIDIETVVEDFCENYMQFIETQDINKTFVSMKSTNIIFEGIVSNPQNASAVLGSANALVAQKLMESGLDKLQAAAGASMFNYLVIDFLVKINAELMGEITLLTDLSNLFSSGAQRRKNKADAGLDSDPNGFEPQEKNDIFSNLDFKLDWDSDLNY